LEFHLTIWDVAIIIKELNKKIENNKNRVFLRVARAYLFHIYIFGMDIEHFRHVSLPIRRTPIKYPSRIEEVEEKNKTQEMYSN
jgi:hypothetical protein